MKLGKSFIAGVVILSVIIIGGLFVFGKDEAVTPDVETSAEVASFNTFENEQTPTPTYTQKSKTTYYSPTPINTPTPTSDNTPTFSDTNKESAPYTISSDSGVKNSIINIFQEIGDLNVELAAANAYNANLPSVDEAYTKYDACRGKYTDPSSPSFLQNPFSAENLITQCQENALLSLKYAINTGPILNNISNLSNQAYNSALTCGNQNDCLNTYWTFVNKFESEGFVAR